jgi:hypothetical protein
MQRNWMRELIVNNFYHGWPGTRDLEAVPELRANP